MIRNKNSENDVNAYRKRKEIEEHIRLLELLLPFKEYIDARNEYGALKERRERVHERCKQLEQRNKPALELKEYVIQSDSLQRLHSKIAQSDDGRA